MSEILRNESLTISSRRILWVEGNEEFSAALERILQDDGFEVVSAVSAAAGLQMATKHQFDLYLLDLSLPDVSGIELLQRIREFEPGARVVFISAGSIAAEKYQAAGCDLLDCCLQPSDFTSLKRTIRSLLDSSDGQRLHGAPCAS